MLRHLKMYLAPNEGAGTPPAGNPPTPPAGGGTPPAPPPTNDPQDVKSLPEWAQKALADTRKEAADHRVRAKDRDELAAKLKEREDAELSESDKAKKRVTELEAQLQTADGQRKQLALEREIEREARKLNIVDEEAALALLDKSRLEFEGDKPKNVSALLADLVKSKPYLVQGAYTPPNSTNGSTGGGGAGTLSLETIRKMSPQEIARLPKAEYDKVLAAANQKR